MVEDVIREAIERGDFDNLPGKGRPLNLAQDSLADPVTSIVNRILRDNDLAHPLLEARKALIAERERARAELQRAFRSYEQSRSEQAWEEAVGTFRARVKEINREIRLFNLKSPSPALHGLALDAEAEIAKVCRADAQPNERSRV